MTLPKLEDLVAGLKARIADPARQAIAVQLAADVAKLQVRGLAGEDVTREMQHVRAQAESLTAAEAAIVNDLVMSWIGSIAGKIAYETLVGMSGGSTEPPPYEHRGRRGGQPDPRASD